MKNKWALVPMLFTLFASTAGAQVCFHYKAIAKEKLPSILQNYPATDAVETYLQGKVLSTRGFLIDLIDQENEGEYGLVPITVESFSGKFFEGCETRLAVSKSKQGSVRVMSLLSYDALDVTGKPNLVCTYFNPIDRQTFITCKQ
jgi:hypothetical protein